MLTKANTRSFGSINKNVVILSNSQSTDTVGAKIMTSLKQVSGQNDFNFMGYGGPNMRQAGLQKSEFDNSQLLDKSFYTFRKTKVINESYFVRYNPLNLINKHYTRNTNDVWKDMLALDIPRKIYQHRPSVILSLENEYLTQTMNTELANYYGPNNNDAPQRHFWTRFVKDFRQFSLQYFDFVHYSINQVTAVPDGFRFPSQYVGQHGVYEALRHLMENDAQSKSQLGENSIKLSKKTLAADTEKLILRARDAFRNKHNITEDTTIIFFAPGNIQSEQRFSYESVRKGVEEFLLKYSAPTSLSHIAKPKDKFLTIISLEQGQSE